MDAQIVKTTHANGETRFWVLLGPVRVIDFQASAAKHRDSPVRGVEFIRIEDVPGTIAEIHPVQD